MPGRSNQRARRLLVLGGLATVALIATLSTRVGAPPASDDPRVASRASPVSPEPSDGQTKPSMGARADSALVLVGPRLAFRLSSGLYIDHELVSATTIIGGADAHGAVWFSVHVPGTSGAVMDVAQFGTISVVRGGRTDNRWQQVDDLTHEPRLDMEMYLLFMNAQPDGSCDARSGIATSEEAADLFHDIEPPAGTTYGYSIEPHPGGCQLSIGATYEGSKGGAITWSHQILIDAAPAVVPPEDALRAAGYSAP